jgi:hypothetical protein
LERIWRTRRIRGEYGSVVTYKEMVVGGLLDELLAVHDRLFECGAERDHFEVPVRCIL